MFRGEAYFSVEPHVNGCILFIYFERLRPHPEVNTAEGRNDHTMFSHTCTAKVKQILQALQATREKFLNHKTTMKSGYRSNRTHAQNVCVQKLQHLFVYSFRFRVCMCHLGP